MPVRPKEDILAVAEFPILRVGGLGREVLVAVFIDLLKTLRKEETAGFIAACLQKDCQ